ncbi:polysaccharide biosynthesis protein [Sporolactobacillus sp. CPB3-1]|uniref:Polysaccharide biosynthesis protein n=1 Tax=Sporolactobacillus mangiferae TaxID=2940498 RepID=A0ABT0M6U2_9BACL|nr:polysaccharide biosynthesis protein [Sporolactobacillus mangiferae]MCL1630571.1 polysaccharide biosynthesis protein [Sporolactobacillus mangiferae]
MLANQIILVTGGTGSWGYELIHQLLDKQPKEIRIFSRNEANQFTMKQQFDQNPKLRFIIGDIREKDALFEACRDVDYIFHLAALKHVPICEEQPIEALKTNVIGTQHVIDAAIHCGVKKVVYISTDKASDPLNFYGLSKAMGERLMIHANTMNRHTRFVCVRGGNVLGTNGSVIHVFKKQIIEKQRIGITDLEMTRFFLSVQDAVKLALKAAYESVGGEIYVMKMPSCKIIDLAQVLSEAAGIKKIDVTILGIRPGEKIHELLLSVNESMKTVIYDEAYYVILPTVPIKGLAEHYAKYPAAKIADYRSDQDLMSKDEIKAMLKKGGFI